MVCDCVHEPYMRICKCFDQLPRNLDWPHLLNEFLIYGWGTTLAIECKENECFCCQRHLVFSGVKTAVSLKFNIAQWPILDDVYSKSKFQ